jgi:hypothetical protein
MPTVLSLHDVLLWSTSFLTFAAALFGAWHGRNNAKAIEVIRVEINSRLSQLLAASISAAHGEGVAEGRALEKVDPVVVAEAAAKVLETAQHVPPPVPR